MKQKLITEYFKENKKRKITSNDVIKGYNPETDSWHCTECGIDMGKCNPRQLCGKYYCCEKNYYEK